MNSSLLFLFVSLGIILGLLMVGAGGILSVSPGDPYGILPDLLLLSGFLIGVATIAFVMWKMRAGGRR